MPDSVMLNSYLMLYQILLYHFPLYLIPDCPLECYNRFLFSVIPDSVLPDSVIPDSCFIESLLYLFPLYPIPLYLIPVWHVIIVSVIPGSLHPLASLRGNEEEQKRKKDCRRPGHDPSRPAAVTEGEGCGGGLSASQQS